MTARAPSIKNLVVLEARETDADDVARLFDAYRVFYGQSSDVPAARSFIVERMRKRDSVIYLARGDAGGRVVALGFTQLYPAYSSVTMKRLWILNDLFVAAEGRRQGVGRRLIGRARQLAIDTRAKGLVLETAVDNVSAQALYEVCGWLKDTEFHRYYLDV
jgi:ribosomal protein S18 acetylase RimI-like enzyme